MKYLITIEKGSDSVTEFNNSEMIYEDYLSTYADVYVRYGVLNTDDKFGNNILYTTEFTIIYQPKTSKIDTTYRVRYNNKLYSIIEVNDNNRPRKDVKLICKHYGS